MTFTRRAFAAAAVALAAQPAAARAADDDRQPLEALEAYQRAVVAQYDALLADAPLSASDRGTIRGFRSDAARTAAVLRKAVAETGGEAAAIPPAAPPADRSRRGWLRGLIALESEALHAYYDSLQTLTGERHLSGAAAFMTESGRRLVVLRRLAGDPLLPRAFETGTA